MRNNHRRSGFTLIELIVAMAILLVLIAMSFSAFSFVNTFSRARQDREAVLENVTIVLDQLTKELRQTITIEDNIAGAGNYGVKFPAYSSSSDTVRDLTTISTPSPPLAANQYYLFGSDDTESGDDPSHPILQFFVLDETGAKHRISYTLGVPNNGGNYTGKPKQYWADPAYEPCEVWYSNEKWNGSSWTGVVNQPVTEQVITNFTVIRPKWSRSVIQIVIEAKIKDVSGSPSTVTRIAQITLRQGGQ